MRKKRNRKKEEKKAEAWRPYESSTPTYYFYCLFQVIADMGQISFFLLKKNHGLINCMQSHAPLPTKNHGSNPPAGNAW
jgi:hypothetical protein